MINKAYIYIAGIALSIASLAGCGSANPPCLTKQNAQLRVSWGERYSNPGVTRGYLIADNATLYEISGDFDGLRLTQKKLRALDVEKYCPKLSLVQLAIMRNQTLSVPGDTIRFVEYENPATKLRMVAEWNPSFKTVGNKDFAALYDSLETLVK